MASIEEDISRIETLFQELKNAYDQYLKGDMRACPDRFDDQIQAILRAQGAKVITNPTLRFRYQNVVAKYNSFKTLWTRRRRELEEGRRAPIIAGQRYVPPPEVPPAPAARETETRSTDPQSPGCQYPSGPRTLESAIVSGGQADDDTVTRLYVAYARALGPGGAQKVSFQSFKSQIDKVVARQADDAGAAGVKFQIVFQEGKVKITSRPLKGKQEG